MTESTPHEPPLTTLTTPQQARVRALWEAVRIVKQCAAAGSYAATVDRVIDTAKYIIDGKAA